jgi:hypothetical protein
MAKKMTPKSAMGDMAASETSMTKFAPRIRASKSVTGQSQSGSPSVDDIRRRAYELYMQRGCGPGNQLQDWFQAERELMMTANA